MMVGEVVGDLLDCPFPIYTASTDVVRAASALPPMFARVGMLCGVVCTNEYNSVRHAGDQR